MLTMVEVGGGVAVGVGTGVAVGVGGGVGVGVGEGRTVAVGSAVGVGVAVARLQATQARESVSASQRATERRGGRIIVRCLRVDAGRPPGQRHEGRGTRLQPPSPTAPGGLSGRRTVKVLPCPGALSTAIVPPCRSTIRALM